MNNMLVSVTERTLSCLFGDVGFEPLQFRMSFFWLRAHLLFFIEVSKGS